MNKMEEECDPDLCCCAVIQPILMQTFFNSFIIAVEMKAMRIKCMSN